MKTNRDPLWLLLGIGIGGLLWLLSFVIIATAAHGQQVWPAPIQSPPEDTRFQLRKPRLDDPIYIEPRTGGIMLPLSGGRGGSFVWLGDDGRTAIVLQDGIVIGD